LRGPTSKGREGGERGEEKGGGKGRAKEGRKGSTICPVF